LGQLKKYLLGKCFFGSSEIIISRLKIGSQEKIFGCDQKQSNMSQKLFSNQAFLRETTEK
jgi:hypothetical protein